jgi:hypothetical protein
MGMDWVLFGRIFAHVQKVFRSVGLLFYEMVVVVTKEGNVLVFYQKQNVENKHDNYFVV